MKINVENYEIECFEQKIDMNYYLNEHKDDNYITSRYIYQGELYGIPEEVKNLFENNVVVQIKQKNFYDVKAIVILKPNQ